MYIDVYYLHLYVYLCLYMYIYINLIKPIYRVFKYEIIGNLYYITQGYGRSCY